MANQKKKIINAHTHVFTGNFVPPYLAKTILPEPFYRAINTGFIVRLFKKYYHIKYKRAFALAKTEAEKDELYQAIYSGKAKERQRVKRLSFIKNHWFINVPFGIIRLWITLLALLFFIEGVSYLLTGDTVALGFIASIEAFMEACYLYIDWPVWVKVCWTLLVIILVKWSRTLIVMAVKSTFPIFKKLINKKTLELLERYLLLGRFAFYERQKDVAERAMNQLPPDSGMVMLPMDMEYMGAGKTKFTKALKASIQRCLNDPKDPWTQEDVKDVYHYQMRELWDFVKDKKQDFKAPKPEYYPFLFVDPRRMKTEGKAFFDYEVVNDRMVLKPCFVKTYMEDRKFSGFKIYPALGYYVFDELLLPIWRYAAENNIPIMTHCIVGTIFYRGKLETDWHYHPIFKEAYARDDFQPKHLPQLKHAEFQFNFTHPMNYLCLVDETLFKQVLSNTDEGSEARQLFGYKATKIGDELKVTITHNLNNLKICLAHFGGEEEWTRYMEQDRNVYSQRLMRDPEQAIKLTTNSKGEFSWYKINEVWDKADWYSIICSMLINYENIYADLSYIISKSSIYPLLQYSLEKNENFEAEHAKYVAESDPNKKAQHYTGKNKLRSRILFGTDFYVVRNHKSDKDLFVETKTLLSEENFDLIARENTHNYLTRKYS